ncbi:procathepsin L-like [Nematolebias whitei]|uniref:procathepsin L-like n=1 Tax=Nematolebias whitei TaxID=451745 RepID=UPI0018990624|nr:procathepsin L-like [Nematolebias whitei]
MLPVAVMTVCLSVALSAPTLDPELDQHWDQWKSWHQKNYDEKEEVWRRGVWEKNLRMIELHNLEHSMGKHTYRLGMNHFGDMTNEEFRQIMTCYRPREDRNASLFMKPNFLKAPPSVDWRTKYYVTPVKYQGSCGSCWAFSATGAMEGQLFKKTGKLVPLSEQNLMDCSGPEGNYGCYGGWMNNAFKYVMNNGGLDSEAYYPYVGTVRNAGPCRYSPMYNAIQVNGIVNILSGNESELMNAVATVGPISVAFDASHDSFRFYSSGIYYEPSCVTRPTHAGLAVGYVSLPPVNYWIVKNSWGTSWGEEGYIRMSKDRGNNCGIASYPSYPLV